jgi:D-serine deaminase-like pyridoxal phosphate-dependent protein
MNRPRTTLDIPTPALVIDVPAMERNIRRMAAFFAGGPCRLRPHFKAHKTPEIARRQLAAGSCTGITCATVAEAEAARSLCGDLLIANEVIGPDKCDRVAVLAGSARVTIAVDSTTGLEQLAAACRRRGAVAGVLIDLNVGQSRCGVAPGPGTVALARAADRAEGVELRGVMGYEGHLVALSDRGERETRTRHAMELLVATARSLRDSGLRCDMVSAGGTGTYDISGRIAGITEIQAGSYVLMDSDYARLDLPFEQAFFVLGTVVSRPDDSRLVADCGHKSTSKDHGYPLVEGIPGAAVMALHDEHATIAVPPDCPLVVGDRIRLRPSHIDPTINLHDVFYATDGQEVTGIWPIVARGYGEQRAVVE